MYSQQDLRSCEHRELIHPYLQTEGFSESDINVICDIFGLYNVSNLASIYHRFGLEKIAYHILQDERAKSIDSSIIEKFQRICYVNYEKFKERLYPQHDSHYPSTHSSYNVRV